MQPSHERPVLYSKIFVTNALILRPPIVWRRRTDGNEDGNGVKQRQLISVQCHRTTVKHQRAKVEGWADAKRKRSYRERYFYCIKILLIIKVLRVLLHSAVSMPVPAYPILSRSGTSQYF